MAVRRLMGGGIWEFRPETRRAEIMSKGLMNPWGFEFDRWGQSFACDGAGGEGMNFIFPGSVFATSPGAKRILHGLSPGQPKQCGMEVIEDPHFPADWQGSFVLNDFRGNRVNRFKLTPSGSSYIAKQMPDVLAEHAPGVSGRSMSKWGRMELSTSPTGTTRSSSTARWIFVIRVAITSTAASGG
jgi:hypothetical protein